MRRLGGGKKRTYVCTSLRLFGCSIYSAILFLYVPKTGNDPTIYRGKPVGERQGKSEKGAAQRGPLLLLSMYSRCQTGVRIVRVEFGASSGRAFSFAARLKLSH